jgi:predicted enzyme related to lactoylglutathione lyase
LAKAVWAVLMSRDVEGAKAFYGGALGWTFELFAAEPFPCWIARNPQGRSVGAFVDSSGSDFPDAPELWLPYFVIDDLDARLAEAEELGATVLRPPFRMPNAGRIAVLRQPGGGIVGWITALPET